MKNFLIAMMMVLVGSSHVFAAATIVVVNADGPNEGFNDPTAAAPIGGNAGTTLGQQRLIAFQHAANIWGSTLDSNQTIYIQAAFNPLPANVLGRAGATFIFSDFGADGFYPGPEFPETWYGSSLADKRAGAELNPDEADIAAEFSSNFDFYLGLDNNHGTRNDLVAVLLHEFGHGLNFQTFVSFSTGANAGGQTDIYARHMLDTTNGLYWNEMTQAQRLASSVRFGQVVWDGTNVTSGVPTVLAFGSPELKVLVPPAIAGPYQFGTAAFGPPISSLAGTISRPVVLALDPADGSGPSTTDGCTALTNGALVAGNIALVDRGTCAFTVKAKNAQNAGAVAVLVANNVAGAPPGLGGVDATITIPTVSVTLGDANSIKANLPGVSASIGKDLSIRAGADALGRARLYMPNPVQLGSSGSHFDTIAFPNLLMEPAINPDLTHNVKAPSDLTLELLRDVGWFADVDLDGVADGVDCNPMSNRAPTIVIGGSNTGVPNTLFPNGCTISDLIQKIGTDASNHGQFASGVSHLTNELKDAGLISGKEKGAIQSSAARANIP